IVHTSSGNVTIRRAGGGSTAATYVLPAGAEEHDRDVSDLDRSIDQAFSEAFGEEFETRIEALVTTSVGTFASGLAQFTADVTVSALEEAVGALERAEREGRLTVEARGDLAELRKELSEFRDRDR